jgi:ParB-like chromosome segregation protein Spo0J
MNNASELSSLQLEEVALDQLKPHKRNYRGHPDDEIEHLVASIHAYGIYRNIVIANEGTILAGRGVTIAAGKAGYSTVPVYRAPFGPDDPRAIKLLVADNEISHLAENDDRALTELLRELKDFDLDLLGTGYDDMMLANLVMVSRPASEIEDLDAAAQWVGMPEYDMEEGDAPLVQVLVNFESEEARDEFCQRLDIKIPQSQKRPTIWWPPRAIDDNKSICFTNHEKD